MKKFLFIGIIPLILISLSMKSDKPAYTIFTGKGKTADYADLLKEANTADIILFGELHDNPICHWLEYELTSDLFSTKGTNLVLGAEMFEADNQLLVNEYINKIIRKKDFEAEAKLWPNYKTDYAPIMSLARDSAIKVVATNIPRRYAALVNAKGLECLDTMKAISRAYIAPLPIHYDSTLECYSSIRKNAGEGMPVHLMKNLPQAQAIKDATMAHFILKNGIEDQTTFLHFNGAYHSDNYQGIVWYLNDYLKRTNYSLKIMTISCVEQDGLKDLSKGNVGRADFIIVIPATMTKSQ